MIRGVLDEVAWSWCGDLRGLFSELWRRESGDEPPMRPQAVRDMGRGLSLDMGDLPIGSRDAGLPVIDGALPGANDSGLLNADTGSSVLGMQRSPT